MLMVPLELQSAKKDGLLDYGLGNPGFCKQTKLLDLKTLNYIG